MSDWPFVKLGSLGTFKNGLNYSKENWGEGVKVIGVSDFQDYLYPRYEELEEINPNGVVRDSDYLEEGDILFVRSNGNRMLIGRSLFIKDVPEKISHSGFTIRLRFTSSEAHIPFYVHLFRMPVIRNALSATGSGTNINNLNQQILSNLDVPLPPIETQRKIGAIVSAYDALIENYQRQIGLLEALAQNLYREWFVRGRCPYAQMQDVGTKNKLKNFVEMNFGQSPSSAFYNDTGDGLPFHQGVGTYGNRFPRHEVYCSVDGKISEEGDILFSVRAPVGRLNIADRKLILGRGLASLRHKDGYNSFLFYLLRETFSKEDIIGNGAIFASVSRSELEEFEVFYPPKHLVEKYDQLINPYDRKILNLEKEIKLLRQMRDKLLPRLMSGQLAVDAAEVESMPRMF